MVQLELMLPPPCRNYIQARNPTTVQGMVADIERFFAERGSSWDDPKWGQPKPVGPQWKGAARNHIHSNQQPSQSTDKNIPATPPKPQLSPKPDENTSTSPKKANRHSKLTCYTCNMEGHIARNCPEKGSRVHRVQHSRDHFIIDASVNDMPTTAVVDSGADVTVVPAKLIAPSAYTGQSQWTGGLNVAGPLPTARVKLTVGGKATEMTVVTKEGLPQVLLGLNFWTC